MSKGSPIIRCRVKPSLLAQIQQYLVERKLNAFCEEWTISDFLVHSAMDKLAHIKRSRERRPKTTTVMGDFDGIDTDAIQQELGYDPTLPPETKTDGP